MPKDNPKAFKFWIDRSLLLRIADSIEKVHPRFDRKGFLANARKLDALELKPRVRFIRDCLRAALPDPYPEALEILLGSLASGKLTGFDLWAYTEFVQTYGQEHLKISLAALHEFTQLFTSEFAVRPFLVNHPDETLMFLKKCARHPNAHVRRWASEGSRPLLPWGERLNAFVKDPRPTLALLEILKHDDELYVRKSVANHLNDIAKHHPEKVIAVLKKWQRAAGPGHEKKVMWITHRALRTLIKQGDPAALKLIGASAKIQVEVGPLVLARRKVRVGDRLEFSFHVSSRSKKSQKLVIDYKIGFVKANGDRSPKVFKLKTFQLGPGESLTLLKAHSLKEITTRRYYSGAHLLEVQINGRAYRSVMWMLRS